MGNYLFKIEHGQISHSKMDFEIDDASFFLGRKIMSARANVQIGIAE
jgi:hypothetical protein